MSHWGDDGDFCWRYIPRPPPRCNKCRRPGRWHSEDGKKWVLYENGAPHRCGTDFGPLEDEKK